MLQRLHLPQASAALPRSITTAPPGELLQDFQPIAESVEWQLATAYWSSAGLLPFVDNEVPFLITNDGRLSARAAEVFFAHCAESHPLPPRITALELGAGTGLFARYFLDALQLLCEEHGRDYYSRLTCVITDRSPRTVEQWDERQVFARHRDHVITAIFDPADGNPPRTLDGRVPDVPPYRAAFCNYVLDVLPSTIVRVREHGPEELRVRTYIAAEPAVLAQHTSRSCEQIRDLLRDRNGVEPSDVASILPLLEFETRFHPFDAGRVPHVDEALAWGRGLDRILLNYGAFDALHRLFASMAPEGFVLLNDYGAVTRDEVPQQSVSQRFGPTLAFGLNFPLLEHHWAAGGGLVLKPEGDDERGLHARFLARAALPATGAAFLRVFSADAQLELERAVEAARAHAAAGRWNEALEGYRAALAMSPRCWHLIGEAAEFVSLQLRAFDAGLEMIRAAVELNPCYSSWLWNVLGDTLYCLERYRDAHEAYMQAARIHPTDSRTSLNLAYTHLYFHRYPEALDAIAAGLLHDAAGIYRTRLLEKQQGVLSALSARREADLERAMRRVVRFQ